MIMVKILVMLCDENKHGDDVDDDDDDDAVDNGNGDGGQWRV